MLVCMLNFSITKSNKTQVKDKYLLWHWLFEQKSLVSTPKIPSFWRGMSQTAAMRTSAGPRSVPGSSNVFRLAHIQMKGGWMNGHTFQHAWKRSQLHGIPIEKQRCHSPSDPVFFRFLGPTCQGSRLSVLWHLPSLASGVWNTPSDSTKGQGGTLAQGPFTFSRIIQQQIWIPILVLPCSPL